MGPVAQSIGLAWSAEGLEGLRIAVICPAANRSRVFRTIPAALTFLNSLPIEGFLAPSGDDVDGVPEIRKYPLTKTESLRMAREKMQVSAATSAVQDLTLYTMAPAEQLVRLFKG